MANKMGQAAKAFFSPEALAPFLLGWLCLGVLSNSLYTVITKLLGDEIPSLILMGIGALVVMLTSLYLFERVVTRDRSSSALPPNVRKPAKRRGLIIMVSHPAPCRKAIGYHLGMLERCWMLCSKQTLEVAQQLRQQFAEVCLDPPIVVNDVNDPLEYRRWVDTIYRALPEHWQVSDVISDYVGMTAHGSVGMVLACLEQGRPLQYTAARYDEQLKPIESLDPIEIVLDAKAFNFPGGEPAENEEPAPTP
jgi:hypothetical protein